MEFSLEELREMPHTLSTYIVVRNYLEETNDYNAYLFIIQEYINDIPGIEIFKLMSKAHNSFDEKMLETLNVVLFENIRVL